MKIYEAIATALALCALGIFVNDAYLWAALLVACVTFVSFLVTISEDDKETDGYSRRH